MFLFLSCLRVLTTTPLLSVEQSLLNLKLTAYDDREMGQRRQSNWEGPHSGRMH